MLALLDLFLSFILLILIVAIIILLISVWRYIARQHSIKLNPVWIAVSVITLIVAVGSCSKTDSQINNRHAAPPPPLQVIGKIPGDRAQLTLKNAAPQGLKIKFSGGEQQTGDIPLCPNCVIHQVPPERCPEQGNTQTYSINPGEYQVSIDWSGNATPYRGRWKFESGVSYSSCFTLINSWLSR